MLDIQNTADGYYVNFSGEFSIFDVQSVFDALKPVLSEKQTITFDLAQICNIDTSVIQIFMFVKAYLKANDAELKLINHSSAVLSLMVRLGLVHWFNDPVILSPDEEATKGARRGAKK